LAESELWGVNEAGAGHVSFCEWRATCITWGYSCACLTSKAAMFESPLLLKTFIYRLSAILCCAMAARAQRRGAVTACFHCAIGFACAMHYVQSCSGERGTLLQSHCRFCATCQQVCRICLGHTTLCDRQSLHGARGKRCCRQSSVHHVSMTSVLFVRSCCVQSVYNSNDFGWQ
jgi:hypothetical protein